MPHRARRSSRYALLLGVLLAAAGCGRDPGPVVVGAMGPWELDYARMMRLGIELAVAEVNRDGGIGGRPLRVDFRSDGADAARAVVLASEFAADPGVVAVIGPINSGPMVAVAEVVDGRLVAIGPTAASPVLSGISPWIFRLITNDSVFGVILGRRAGRLGRRAAVLYDNNSFGRGGADAFRRNFPGTVVSIDPVASGDTAVEPFVRYWARHEVELVFVAGLNTTGLEVLREARRQGFRGLVLGTDSWIPLVNHPQAAEGVLIGTRFSVLERRPEVVRFVRDFAARYGEQPDGFAAYGYDATRVLTRALNEGGVSRRAVHRYLSTLQERGGASGVTGLIAFTATGDPVAGGFVLLTIRDGELLLVGADDS